MKELTIFYEDLIKFKGKFLLFVILNILKSLRASENYLKRSRAN